MSDKVKMETPSGDIMELDFNHALELLRLKEKEGRNNLKVVGNHEFINNELIIKPSTRSGKKSTKSKSGGKGKKVSEPTKDSDTSL